MVLELLEGGVPTEQIISMIIIRISPPIMFVPPYILLLNTPKIRSMGSFVKPLNLP